MAEATVAPINDEILAQAIAHWGGKRSDLTFVREFANAVYRYERNGAAAIFRLTHSSHRTAPLIQAELDWIRYLAAGGVPAVLPIATQSGQWLVEIPVAEGSLIAVLWQFAPGGPPQVEDFTPDLYRQMGQLIGQMHRLSVGYDVPDAAAKRFEWFEEADPERLLAGLGGEDAVIRERIEQSCAEMRGWERGREVYHLVHCDVHAGNIFLHNGQIHLFDFDDCSYHWRAYDIANALYYALWRIPRHETEPRATFAQEFMAHFLAGYNAETSLDPIWLEKIPFFLEYRDLLVYAFIRQHVNTTEHEGMRKLLQAIRERVEANQPYVTWEL